MISAKNFHPGSYLLEELKTRNMTQKQLSYLIGKSPVEVNNLTKGKRNITVQWALLLEAGLDIPSHIWLGLQQNYNLRLAKEEQSKYTAKLDLVKKRVKELVLA